MKTRADTSGSNGMAVHCVLHIYKFETGKALLRLIRRGHSFLSARGGFFSHDSKKNKKGKQKEGLKFQRPSILPDTLCT